LVIYLLIAGSMIALSTILKDNKVCVELTAPHMRPHT